MEDCLHTSSENLSKLVSWAHSHGTICTLIPSLKHLLTEGSHSRLTAMWGCSAGHAYHWPLSSICKAGPKERICFQDSCSINSDNFSIRVGTTSMQASAGERLLERHAKVKGDCDQMRDSFSNCSEPSEMDENTEEYHSTHFDIVCESSATDEDGDYELHLPHTPLPAFRKRGAPGVTPSQSCHQMSEERIVNSTAKKIKQETPEDYYTAANAHLTRDLHSGPLSLSISQSPKQNSLTHIIPKSSLLHAVPHRPCTVDEVSSLSSLHASSMTKPPCTSIFHGEQSKLSRMVQSPRLLDTPQRPQGGTSSESNQDMNNSLSVLPLPNENGRMEPFSNQHMNNSLSALQLSCGDQLRKSCVKSVPCRNIASSLASINSESTIGVQALTAETITEVSVTPAQFEIERLKVLLQAERSKSELMGETIYGLKQDKELLQQELSKKAEFICDFLQDQLSNRPEKRKGHTSSQPEPSSSHQNLPVFSNDAQTFESSTLFDSFDEFEMHPSERQKTIKTSKRSREGENTRVRMKNVVGVIARYMTALQEFRRSVSMKVAFDRVGVDRNTISRTAAIAELSLAAPDVFHSLPPWDEKEETLAHYAIRCRQAMDDSIKAKIKTMKAKGDLLPIVSK